MLLQLTVISGDLLSLASLNVLSRCFCYTPID